jgi:uncharacterized protein YabE (DUF348 family)
MAVAQQRQEAQEDPMQIDTVPQQDAAVHQLSQQLASGMQLKTTSAAALLDNTDGERTSVPLPAAACQDLPSHA